MSKNLTLKGLALGAIVALGSSFLAGAPASAAVTDAPSVIGLAANVGATNNTLIGATFGVSNTVDQALAQQYGKNPAKIAYLVENSSAAKINISLDAATKTNNYINAISADAVADYAGAYELTAGNPSSTGFTSKKFVTVKAQLNSQTVDTVDKGKNVLTITSTTDTTDNFSVKVTAFVDENGNGKLDAATDYASTPYTVNFIARANVTVTTSIVSAVVGSKVIQAKTVIGNDINNESLAGQVRFGFTKNGTALKVNLTGTTYDTIDSAWSDSVLKNTTTTVASLDGVDTIPASNTIIAQAYLGLTSGSAGATGVYTKLGSASNATTTVLGTEASVDGTDILKVTGSANTVNSADTNDFKGGNSGNASASTAKIKTGYAGNITFTSKLLSVDGTDVKLSGQTVKVTLTKSVLASASTFVAGGVTLTATSGAVSFTTTTDASGVISFTGAGTGAKDDSVAVKIEVLGKSGYKAADVNTITWVDAALTKVVSTDLAGASAERKIEKGASYTLSYKLVDQFGQVFTTGTYRATITASAVSGSTNVAITQYATAVAGVITAAIVDNSTGAGVYSIDAALYKYDSTAASWGSALAGNLDPAAQTVNVNSVVAATVSGTASSTAAVATITKTLVNADLRVDNNTTSASAIGYGATATQTITGAVSDATGARVAGAVVTVTGAGLGFVVNGNVYTIGSATINTDVNGSYSVDVYSTTAGKASVVVTSGAATKSVAIEFSGVTTTINTNVITLDVVSLSQVGRAITATVKVVDKFGNPVKSIAVVVSVTGVGSLSSGTATTAADGTATVQFLAGANDFGDAVITAKYNGVDAAGAEAVVSVVKTVTVGVTDAQVDIVNNRVTAVSSFTKGRTVAFYVDGVKKWSKLSASDADVVVNYNLKKGAHTVTVKISGGFVTTEKFIVK